MSLWNQKILPAPPTFRYKSKTKDLDLVKFRATIQDSIKHFKNEDFIIRETALLSRILYRMKMKFRNTKDFKVLEKINHSLNIYLNTNMVRDLNNILSLTPSKYQTETYLPTRNMLSYILVRLQGLVKLMERIYDTCQIAAKEITLKIAIGHFWKIYIILFSLVSRIHILVKFNTKFMCELYGKFLSYCNKLENTSKSWLPKGYDLPNDLREWLGVPWVYEEEYVDLTFEPSLKIMDFFDLVNDDDDEDDEIQFCDEYVLIDEEDKSIANDFRTLKPVEETFTRNRMRGFSINEDDIGEEITDLITLDDTNYLPLEIIESDKEKDFNSSDADEVLDVEDIGEEISDTENITIEDPQIISLDETDFESNLFDNKNKEHLVVYNNNKEETNILDYTYKDDAKDIGEETFDTENNNRNITGIINLDESEYQDLSIKRNDRNFMGHNGNPSNSQNNNQITVEHTNNKHNKFYTEISHDEHDDVVDISKIYEKTGPQYLNDTDVVVLDDTIPNTLILDRLNNSVFKTSKSIKKKNKKNKLKKINDFKDATQIAKDLGIYSTNKTILFNDLNSSNVQLQNYIKATPNKQISQKTSNKRKNEDCYSENSKGLKKRKKQNDPFNTSQNYAPILQQNKKGNNSLVEATPNKQISQKTSNKRKNNCDSVNNKVPKKRKKQNDPFNTSQNTPILQQNKKGNNSLVEEVLISNQKTNKKLKNKIKKQNNKGNKSGTQGFQIVTNNVELSQTSKRIIDTLIKSTSKKKQKKKNKTKQYDNTLENCTSMSLESPKNKRPTRLKVTKKLDFNIEAVQVTPEVKNKKKRKSNKTFGSQLFDNDTPDQNKIKRNKKALRISLLEKNKDKNIFSKVNTPRLQSQLQESPTIESQLENRKARRSKRWHKKKKKILNTSF